MGQLLNGDVEMKKILVLAIGLGCLGAYAQDSVSEEDRVESTLDASGMIGTDGVGAKAEWKTVKQGENVERTSSSSIDIKPVEIESSMGSAQGTQFHVDIMGDSESKLLLAERGSAVVPFFKTEFSGLEYTFDGDNSSARLLNSAVGAGVTLNLSEDIRLTGSASAGPGLEIGKRDGALDFSVKADARLDLGNFLSIMASDELRSSWSGDTENLSRFAASVAINDRTRAGVEFERSENRIADFGNYNTSYGGAFLKIQLGGGKSR